ncbi:MAG: hypothetical protein V4466_12070 [Pseudomonadota bacterium]
MGQRNPDRVSIRERYELGRDVAAMARARWDVISVCRACGLMMQVDLKLIAYVNGPRTSLWNRRARCRRIGCNGAVEFQARAPGMAWHEQLAIDPRLPAEPGWAERRLAQAAKRDPARSKPEST